MMSRAGGQRAHVVPGAERGSRPACDRSDRSRRRRRRSDERTAAGARRRTPRSGPSSSCRRSRKSARQAVDVGDQLHLVLHDGSQRGIAPGEPATNAPTRLAKAAIRSTGHSDASPWINAAVKASPVPTGSTTSSGVAAPRCTRRRRTSRSRVPPTSRRRPATGIAPHPRDRTLPGSAAGPGAHGRTPALLHST